MIDPYTPASALTKREQLIYTALQGLLANPTVNNGTSAAYTNIVQQAISIADALIEAVNTPEQVPVFFNTTISTTTTNQETGG